MSSLWDDPDFIRNVNTFLNIVTATLGGSALAVSFGTRRHARATRDQVENNHFDENGNPINLRDEQDRRQADLVDALGGLKSGQTQITTALNAVRSDVGGIREDVRRLQRHDDDADERIRELEQTTPRPPAPRTRRKQP